MRTLLILLLSCSASCSLLFETPDPSCEFTEIGDFVDDNGASRYLVAKCDSGADATQDGAQLRCGQLGGRLVNIESAAEHAFLLAAIRGGEDYWIGLQYDLSAGFSWGETSSAVNVFCGPNDCSSMLPVPVVGSCFVMDFDLRGAWLPEECDHDDDYICEIEL